MTTASGERRTATGSVIVTERKKHWLFDRPKPPHDWRWVVGWIGKVLIVVGLLMFAFVAYQLWGTGIYTAQAQNRLEDQFRQAGIDATTLPPTTATTTTIAPATTSSTPPVPTGGATTSPATTTTIPRAHRARHRAVPVRPTRGGQRPRSVGDPEHQGRLHDRPRRRGRRVGQGPGPLPRVRPARPARQHGHRRSPHDPRRTAVRHRRARSGRHDRHHLSADRWRAGPAVHLRRHRHRDRLAERLRRCRPQHGSDEGDAGAGVVPPGPLGVASHGRARRAGPGSFEHVVRCDRPRRIRRTPGVAGRRHRVDAQ